MGEQAHSFDRRAGDVNYESLRVQLKSLQDHVHEHVVPELRATSQLTKQVHEAMFGRGDDKGVIQKVQEVHDAFSAAKGGLKVLETMGKVAKPILVLGALWAFVVALVHGSVEWPKW